MVNFDPVKEKHGHEIDFGRTIQRESSFIQKVLVTQSLEGILIFCGNKKKKNNRNEKKDNKFSVLGNGSSEVLKLVGRRVSRIRTECQFASFY